MLILGFTGKRVGPSTPLLISSSDTDGPARPFAGYHVVSHAATRLVWESKIEHRRKFVLVAIAERINRSGTCWPSVSDLSKMCDLSERHTRRILTDLEPFLIREERPGHSTIYRLNEEAIISYTPDAHVTPDTGVTPDVDVTPPLTPTSATPDAHVTPTTLNRKRTVIEPLKEGQDRKFSDWDMKAAEACEQRLLASGNLDSSLSESEREKWAGEFRKLREIDRKSEELIAFVMRWLFEIDDFWIPKGNFCTAMKLRAKDKNGTKYFKRFELAAIESKFGNGGTRNGRGRHGSVEEEIAKAMAP